MRVKFLAQGNNRTFWLGSSFNSDWQITSQTVYPLCHAVLWWSYIISLKGAIFQGHQILKPKPWKPDWLSRQKFSVFLSTEVSRFKSVFLLCYIKLIKFWSSLAVLPVSRYQDTKSITYSKTGTVMVNYM